MRSATLAAAEAAQEKLVARLGSLPGLRGIGIAPLDKGFCIKLNLAAMPAGEELPDDVDGVPVIVDIVGSVRPL